MVSHRFADEIDRASIVIPGHAGIQRSFEVLDSGSR